MIVGSTTTITAPVPQPLLGPGYLFAGWSDGGAATHDLVAPAAAMTYTARYARLSVAPPPGGTPEAPRPAGPVAAYGFEEARGAAVGDASGHGNTGAIAGARRTAAGRFGRALSFDGHEDWVTVPDGPSLRLRGGMTIEAWVYPTAGRGAWRTVAVKERRSGLAYGLHATAAGRRPAGAAAGHAARGAASLPIRRWSHLAVTFDGARLVLYVNGAAIAGRPAPGAIAGSTEALRIGGDAVWDEWFAGRIDETRVYDRALGASALCADMAAAVGRARGRIAAPRVRSLRSERRRRRLPLARHSFTR
jgi:hypothetical protein